MTLTGLVIKEMARRRLGLALSILAAVAATAAYVSVETLSGSAQDALRRSMLKLGHNILIVPKGAPRGRLWTAQFGDYDMPEQVLDELVEARHLDIEHYTSRLQRRIHLGDDVLAVLTGVRSVSVAVDRDETEALEFEFDGPDEAHLGGVVANRLGKGVGDTISLSGRTFTIGRVREERGNAADIRIYIGLKTMQAMMDRDGRIDSIAALARVRSGARNPLKRVTRQLAALLGASADVIVVRDPFQTRDKSRRMLQTLSAVLSVVLLALCGLGLALYIHHNVSERRYETAVLLALGYRPWQVTAALLSSVIVVGVAAGVGGLLGGMGLAVAVGPGLVAVETVRPLWGLWWRALAFALGLCVAAAGVAVWGALRAAPAEVLRNR